MKLTPIAAILISAWPGPGLWDGNLFVAELFRTAGLVNYDRFHECTFSFEMDCGCVQDQSK